MKGLSIKSSLSCLFAFLVVAGCGPNPTEEKNNITSAKRKCELDGKYSGSPYEASSLYDGVANDSDTYIRATDLLLGRGFKLVEYARKPVLDRRPSGSMYYNTLFEDGLESRKEEKYVRLYLAPLSDEHCAPFKRFISMLPNLYADNLRWKGLKADQCIAVQLTNELQADVEHLWEGDSVSDYPEGYWGRWSLYRERITAKELGKVWTGGYKTSYTCQNEAELEKLDQSISNRTNTTIAIPPITELKKTIFPLRLVAVPETIGEEQSAETQVKHSWSKPKFDIENWFLPGSLIDNGFTFMRPAYGKSTMRTKDGSLLGVGVGLVGNRLYIIRNGLRQITNIEDDGRTFPSCSGLHRIGDKLAVLCDAQQDSVDSEKWLRQNFLLVYDNLGRPIKKYTFRFDQSVLANQTVWAVRDAGFLGDGRILATVHYTKRENDRLAGNMQAEVVFKVLESD